MKGNPLKERLKRKRLELMVAGLGYLIGIGLGLWFILLMLINGISK
jgi:hypothetical protein